MFVASSRGVLPPVLYDSHYQLYQTQLTQAEELLLAALNDRASDLTYKMWVWGGLCEVSFSKFLFQESDENKSALEYRLAEAEKIASQIYKENNTESWFSFFDSVSSQAKYDLFAQSVVGYGYYYLIYSVYHFRVQKTVTGTYYFRKSWKYFEQAKGVFQKMREHNLEPQIEITGLLNFGVALFHLLMSLVPPNLQGFLSIMGFEGNRESAILELEACIKSATPRAAEAAILLAVTRKFLLDDEEAFSAIFSRLQSLYPNSALICYTTGFISRLTGDLENSITHFKKTQQYAKQQNSTQLAVTASYHIGYSHFMLSQFDQVITYYENFLSISVTETQKRFRPYAAFTLGFSYWMMDVQNGNTELRGKILPLFKSAEEWIRMHESYDQFAKRKMDEFVAKGEFDFFDIFQHKIGALVEGKQFDTALQQLSLCEERIFANPKPEKDFQALFHFYQGSCFFGKGELDAAIVELNRAISLEKEVKIETYSMPYCWNLLGEIEMKQKNYSKAKDHFAKSKSYSDYDWQKLLAVRLYSNNQKLAVYEAH